MNPHIQTSLFSNLKRQRTIRMLSSAMKLSVHTCLRLRFILDASPQITLSVTNSVILFLLSQARRASLSQPFLYVGTSSFYVNGKFDISAFSRSQFFTRQIPRNSVPRHVIFFFKPRYLTAQKHCKSC